MADVVVEVTNVEIDFARAEVVFEVLLHDPTLDDDESVEVTAPPIATAPPVIPGYEQPAVTVIGRDVLFPITSGETTIDIEEYTAVLPDGAAKVLPQITLTGLDPLTAYGVFFRDDVGYEVEPAPARGRKAEGGYLFLGFTAIPRSILRLAVGAATGPSKRRLDGSAQWRFILFGMPTALFVLKRLTRRRLVALWNVRFAVRVRVKRVVARPQSLGRERREDRCRHEQGDAQQNQQAGHGDLHRLIGGPPFTLGGSWRAAVPGERSERLILTQAYGVRIHHRNLRGAGCPLEN